MKLIKLAIIFFLVFFLTSLTAADFKKNVNYSIINSSSASQSHIENVEVIEFFLFSCPHCFQLEPYLKDWLRTKPKNVSFKKIPALFGGNSTLHARVFYSLEAIGADERIFSDIFEEIHVNNKRLRTSDSVEKLLEEKGINLTEFRSAMTSFSVKMKIDKAAKLMEKYQIRSVPKIVVNGKYKTERVSTYKEIIDLTDFLILQTKIEK